MRPGFVANFCGAFLRAIADRVDPIGTADMVATLRRMAEPDHGESRHEPLAAVENVNAFGVCDSVARTSTDHAFDCDICQALLEWMPNLERHHWPALLNWLGRGPVGERCALHTHVEVPHA